MPARPCSTSRFRLLFAIILSSITLPLAAQEIAAPLTFVHEDFQNGFGDWFADNGVWQVGIPTAGPDSSNSSGMVAGTVLDGTYPQNARSRLVSPPFMLQDSTNLAGSNLRLSFRHWYDFNSQDEGRMQISVDGAPWIDFPDLNPFTGSGSGWESPLPLDLTPYAGKEISIAFLFTASPPLESHGWYIDDVHIFSEEPRVFGGFEGFTSPVLDWEIEGGSWEFGVPSAGNDLPAHALDGIAATVLNGIYSNTASPRLISPELRLSSDSIASFLRIRFDHQFHFAPGDTGFVQMSVNDSPWQTISDGFYGFSGSWTRYVATDLPGQLSAGDRVRFAFLLAVNSNVASQDGWQIDNISISMDSPGIYGPFVEDENAVEALIGPEAPSPTTGIEWYSDNGLWEIGAPASGPGSAHTDSLVAATNLDGAYTNGAFSRFVSPPLQIKDAFFALSFWHWFDFNPGDHGIVQISVNYGEWIDLSSQPFTFSSGGWSLFRINDVAGKILDQVDESEIINGTVRIGFLFTSQQTGNTAAGWYLDDIKLEGLLFTSNETYERPQTAVLHQNYPNPFNPSTTIGFTLEAGERASLKIYDLLGREIATLLENEFLPAGAHRYTWEASRQASGVYLYKLETAASTIIRRMHLVK